MPGLNYWKWLMTVFATDKPSGLNFFSLDELLFVITRISLLFWTVQVLSTPTPNAEWRIWKGASEEKTTERWSTEGRCKHLRCASVCDKFVHFWVMLLYSHHSSFATCVKAAVVRELSTIPSLIYAIEQHEKLLIQLMKKSKVSWHIFVSGICMSQPVYATHAGQPYGVCEDEHCSRLPH